MVATFFDLRRLRYIVAIADHGSISAAARDLNVAQPALTYHLSSVEEAIGQQLFERQSTGVVATTLGLIFVEHARVILQSTKLAEDDIRRHIAGRSPAGKPFRLAIIPSLAGFMSSRLIDLFHIKFPDRTLHLIDARTAFADELVEHDKVDAAVSLVVALENEHHLLAWEPVCLIAKQSSTRHADTPISLEEAARSDLILPGRGNPLRGFLEMSAARHGVVLNVSMEIDGYEPRRGVVLAGHGSTVMGAFSFTEPTARQGLSVRQIVAPELIRPIVLRTRRGLDPALVESLSRLLTDAFAEVTDHLPEINATV